MRPGGISRASSWRPATPRRCPRRPPRSVSTWACRFAILSDGTTIDTPRLLRRAEKKLKHEKRNLSRKAKGSNNRTKARLKVARAHARVADQAAGVPPALHPADPRQPSDRRGGPGGQGTRLDTHGRPRTRRQLGAVRRAAGMQGRRVRRTLSFEPTSQMCSQCGVKDGTKPLPLCLWECRAYGAVLDRDVNAAVNVATVAGLAVPACRARVRPGPVPAQREETGTTPSSTLTGASRREPPSFRAEGMSTSTATATTLLIW
ncbi:zinc ribbon domain-containing protein [Streptomyces sp. NPDC048350]|uniref:zinc ribbon domain-containing protein n=1 Tax=Streptomyces sp. NPDC048350 TaxID=3365538 RepID=UPI00372183F8